MNTRTNQSPADNSIIVASVGVGNTNQVAATGMIGDSQGGSSSRPASGGGGSSRVITAHWQSAADDGKKQSRND
jgi:hypothetical protein